MTLDNFRTINLTIDKANGHFFSDQFAKEGDYDGRRLVVQITDNGVVEDLSHVDVHLGWKHDDKKNSGLNSFKAVDAGKGIFEVYYPREMLHPGQVTAVIQIVDDGKITETKNFRIKVGDSVINAQGAVEEDSFAVLQEALIKVNQWNNEIETVIEDWGNQFQEKYDGLEGEYAEELTQVNAQLAQTDDKIDWNSLALYNPSADGVIDDTQKIVDAIHETPLGGTLLIPKGIYGISKTIYIEKSITIKSTGAVLIALPDFEGYTPGFMPMLFVRNVKDVTIEGLKLDGNEGHYGGLYPVNTNNAPRGFIVGDNAINIHIINCEGSNIVSNAFLHISNGYGGQSFNVNFVDCYSENSGLSFGQEKFYSELTGNKNPGLTRYIRCSTKNTNHGLYIAGGDDVIVSDSYFESVRNETLTLYTADAHGTLKANISNTVFDNKGVNRTALIHCVNKQPTSDDYGESKELQATFVNCDFLSTAKVTNTQIETPSEVSFINSRFEGGRIGVYLSKSTIANDSIINKISFVNTSIRKFTFAGLQSNVPFISQNMTISEGVSLTETLQGVVLSEGVNGFEMFNTEIGSDNSYLENIVHGVSAVQKIEGVIHVIKFKNISGAPFNITAPNSLDLDVRYTSPESHLDRSVPRKTITSPPLFTSQLAVVDSDIYIAIGTNSVSDWVKITL